MPAMKRLIFATGKWSTILSMAYLKSRGEEDVCENTLVHISHVADHSYLKSFDSFCADFSDFSSVHCINHCIYENSTIENLTFGDIKEKSDSESAILLKEILGDAEFDEIIVPHLFSSKSRLILSMYPNARAYCIEEGLNSYFRHYNKKVLSAGDQYFISRLQGYVSFNFLGLQPLFDFDRHNVPVIVPGLTYVREAIVGIGDGGFSLLDPQNDSKVLFVGQMATANMPVGSLLDHYVSSISSLLLNGFSVYYVRHPRDLSGITLYLVDCFNGQKFYVVDAGDVPVEKIACSYDWAAIVSYASSALISIPALFDVPAFTIDEFELEDLSPGVGDFSNAKNFCAVVTPSLRKLLVHFPILQSSPAQVARRVYEEFQAQPGFVKNIYNRKPPSVTFEYLVTLPLLGIRDRINQNPYKSILRLAYAQKEQVYKRSLRSAWIGLVLNPFSTLGYKVFANSLLRPVFMPIKRIFSRDTPKSEAEIKKLGATAPLSTNALFAHGLFYEEKHKYNTALRFRLLAILARPLHPLSYYYLYRWAYKGILHKIKSKRAGVVFRALFRATLRNSAKRAASLQKKETGGGIAALTFRPNKGPTGGPGGVLALQKSILGPHFESHKLSYIFRGGKQYLDWYADLNSGAEFALDIVETNKYGYYFAHDLGTAYGLALARQKYVVDWHFQGSFVTQMLNFGHSLEPKFIDLLKKIEHVALSEAKVVVFPSDGAREMYFSDQYRGCDLADVVVGPSIYNTILPKVHVGATSKASAIPAFDGLTFTSVGTLTSAKGQDQVLDFFEKMLPLFSDRVRWICIGDGVMRDEVVSRASQLTERYRNFSFTYLQKIAHDDVIEILCRSDVYVMLHRISIFDFATLEAMKCNCAIMLSKVGGNIDFNKEDNIIFAEEIDYNTLNVFERGEIAKRKKLSSEVFARHFSVQNFKAQNFKILEMLVD
jgi:glycosyltransferase involved in cell wall biosynthesis